MFDYIKRLILFIFFAPMICFAADQFAINPPFTALGSNIVNSVTAADVRSLIGAAPGPTTFEPSQFNTSIENYISITNFAKLTNTIFRATTDQPAIKAESAVRFEGNITNTTMTVGSIPFIGTGQFFSQDNANLFWDDANNNLRLGVSSTGTSAAKVFAIGSGIAPTTSPVDAYQIWVEDIAGVAGKAGLHGRAEDGTQIVLGANSKVESGAAVDFRLDTTGTGNSSLTLDRQTSGGHAKIIFQDNNASQWSIGSISSGNLSFRDLDTTDRWRMLTGANMLESIGAGTIRTSTGDLTIQAAGTTLFAGTSGGVVIGRSQTSAAAGLFLDIAQPSVAGTRDSHTFDVRGTSFDTAGHNADWRAQTDVTSNAGASTFTLASRIDAEAFGNRLIISDASKIGADIFNATTGFRIGDAAASANYLRGNGSSFVASTILAGDLPGNFSGFANPTASLGLTAINGTATTAMRSDAAPALNQAIGPTWTGLHKFNPGITPTAAILLDMAQPSVPDQRISHDFQMRATSFDTGGHNADWRFRVVPNSDAGASTMRIDSRIDAAAFQNVITLSDGGGMTVGGLTPVGGGVVNAVVGFRVGNAAATGNYLRGNGTDFVSSSIQSTTQAINTSLANGENNNINFTAKSFVKIKAGPTAGFTITGIANGTDGYILRVYNSIAQNMTIAHESASSTAANRIVTMTGADVVSTGVGAATLIYDSDGSRWILTAFEP